MNTMFAGPGTVYEKYISSEPDIIGDYDTDTAMVQEEGDDEDDDEQDDAMDDGKNWLELTVTFIVLYSSSMISKFTENPWF